ncbi:hypothetical protein [Luteimonas aquatica]|uniref:hypothetical protein n=1 Tax=Luteimonas aquatica TaxID=450364 RepID=UPI001F56EACB|nr:hypothetical protein [Luteimonas aquatica]
MAMHIPSQERLSSQTSGRARSGASQDGIPFHPHWSPQELTDAVPLRLHEMFRYQIEPLAAAANAAPSARHARPAPGYLPAAAHAALFRIV